ncbi:MAG: hypothetical protein ABSB53_04655 [Nitrososphaerales archaeon]|jgi:hypothetical protein
MTSVGAGTESDEAQRIKGNIKNTKIIFEDVAALLETVGKEMERSGWNPESNTAVTGVSGVIGQPKLWLPSRMFRFFKNGRYPSLLAFVSVILDDEATGEYTISEPMATAGVLDFGQGSHAVEDRNWEYWYSEWYGYSSWYGYDRGKDEWPTIQMGPADDWKAKWKEAGARPVSFETFKCFGVPLVEVSSDTETRSKIVAPLLALI